MKFLSSEKLSAHKYKTPEGYLICTDAILARTGTQTYRKNEVFSDSNDDSEIEVDRRPEEVFAPETLASFENKPITVEHPDENVSPENYNELSVGFVRDVRRGKIDGQDVMLGTLVITDARTIDEIENGEHTDLSCGYDCDIADEAHPQQRNIRGNHVALCQQGRAGIARIVDSINDSDYTINFKNDYAGFREKTFIKANSAKNALKEFAKEVSLRGWGTRNVDIISISPNDGNMRLYGNLYDLLKTIEDSIKDSFKVGEKFKTAGGYIAKIIKIGPNVFGTPSVFLQTNTTGPTMIITIDVFEDDIKRGVYTKINDSIKDRAIPSSLINELNRKLEEFKRRGYDESDLEIKVEGNKIWFTGELSYNTHWKLAEELDKILQKYNKDAYFDAETTGRWFAVYDSKSDMKDSFYGGIDEATVNGIGKLSIAVTDSLAKRLNDGSKSTLNSLLSKWHGVSTKISNAIKSSNIPSEAKNIILKKLTYEDKKVPVSAGEYNDRVIDLYKVEDNLNNIADIVSVTAGNLGYKFSEYKSEIYSLSSTIDHLGEEYKSIAWDIRDILLSNSKNKSRYDKLQYIKFKDSDNLKESSDDIAKLVKDLMHDEQIRISSWSNDGKITLSSDQLYSTDVDTLCRAIKRKGFNCKILNATTVQVSDAFMSTMEMPEQSMKDTKSISQLRQDIRKLLAKAANNPGDSTLRDFASEYKYIINQSDEWFAKNKSLIEADLSMFEEDLKDSLKDSLVEYEYKIIDDVIKSCEFKTTDNIIKALNTQYPGFAGSHMTEILNYLKKKNIKDSKTYVVSYKDNDVTYIKKVKATSVLDAYKKIKKSK